MNVVRGFFSGVFCFLLFDVLVFLGLIISINLTLLNPDFVISKLGELDVYSVVIEQAKAQLPGQEFIDAETVDKIENELTPWFEKQTDDVIRDVYAYLKEDRELNVVISLEQVRTVVKENIREAVLNSLPPQLQGVPQNVIDAFMSQLYEGVDSFIPATFQLSETSVGQQVAAQLQQIKQVVGYIDTAYKTLIIVAVVLVLLIALAHWWQPKPITRSIGITFILVGIVCILGPLLDYLIVQAINQFIGTSGIMSEFQAKL